jgi:hypothetical protein
MPAGQDNVVAPSIPKATRKCGKGGHGMDTERWQRLQDLFQAALAVSPTARTDFLARVDTDGPRWPWSRPSGPRLRSGFRGHSKMR